MKMELWRRQDPVKGTVYDVYVINVAPNIAGGMPERWLILHCATKDQFRQRFPNARRADGSPLVKNAPKDAKPQKTTADVSIELTVKQALVEHYVRKSHEAAKVSPAAETKKSPETVEVNEQKPSGKAEASQNIEAEDVAKDLAAAIQMAFGDPSTATTIEETKKG